jgi:hypothetical protein
MARDNPIRIDAEELVNSITHGVGLVLSIAGFAVLLTLAIMHGSALRIVSCAIYGSSLAAVQTRAEDFRPLRDLSPDRRDVHAVPAREFEGRMGLVAPGRDMGTGYGGNPAEILVRGSFQNLLDGSVRGDGLAGYHRDEAAVGACFRAGNCVAGCGRFDVHDWSCVFCGSTPPLWPRHLACVRDGGKHLPLHRRALSRRPGG